MADGNMFSVKKGLFALTLFPHSPVLPVPSMCMTGVCMFVCVCVCFDLEIPSCTGTTQRDGMGREEGGGFRMGNTCIPVVDSF